MKILWKKLIQLLGIIGLGSLSSGIYCSPDKNSVAGEPRIELLPPDMWSSEQKKLFSTQSGEVPHIYQVLIQHPALFSARLPFGRYIQRSSTLPAKDRERIILRVAWLSGSHYVWRRHRLEALQLGLSEKDINQSKQPESRSILYAAVDELIKSHDLKPSTWTELSSIYNQQQKMDLVFTVMGYLMTSVAARVFKVPPEDD